MLPHSAPWQLWIDTGGTFTDCIARDPDGRITRLKILSNSVLRGSIIKRVDDFTLLASMPQVCDKDIFHDFEFRITGMPFKSRVEKIDWPTKQITLQHRLPKKINGRSLEISSGEEVPVFAARLLTATSLTMNFPLLEMKLGSTRGTNAILERKGAKTALLITKGFRDLLTIGNQQRPELFALHIIKPTQLYDVVLEIDERIESDGNVLKPLDMKNVNGVLDKLKKLKIESVAVAFLNSYKNPSHEKSILSTLRLNGFDFVSVSHAISPQIRILPRAQTTVANAYLEPIIDSYLTQIKKGLKNLNLSVMTSAGGLVKAGSFNPKDSLLSGPAGGVVGAARQAARSGIDQLIAFDMGGTSTDVSLYHKRFDYRFESKVGDFSIQSPSLAIETIAAGGGSICDFDGHRFTVGPESAGASPGPACYGAGGPLTITDVNVLLGRLNTQNFAIPIQSSRSQAAVDKLMMKVKRFTGKIINQDQVLESLIQIANEKMAEAIRKISVQEGHNPQDFTLLSFGGAGGQHACALAEILGMKQVLIPYDAGLLSAYGIGHAPIENFEEQLVLRLWKEFESNFDSTLQKLFKRAKEKLIKERISPDDILWKKTFLYLRFAGQDNTLEIDFNLGDNVNKLFREKYISVFGHWIDREIEVESIKIIVSVSVEPEKLITGKAKPYLPFAEKEHWVIKDQGRAKAKVYSWEKLIPGANVKGPAIITSGNSTTYVDTGWTWSLDTMNNAHLISEKKSKLKSIHAEEAQLELFTNRFTAVAQEMGALLQRTSFSVNVKERLDFSCALLDIKGYLVVNAPHIPVHLGSMGVCVREVIKKVKLREGDVVITNHPAYGGSHLPDVTIIKAVFYKKKHVGFVANRAHHAEIGGKKPGSMPANATTLEEEGVIIPPQYLVKNGVPQWEAIRALFSEGHYPTRALEENLADLNGALASVNLGEKGLISLCQSYGPKEVAHYMRVLYKHASSLMRLKIRSLSKKQFNAVEYLDDGSALQAKITRKADRLTIDFTNSSSVHPGNLNATKAIVQSVVLYCLRLLLDHPLPMNEGLMEPIELLLPTGLLNPDFKGLKLPAVVGGNTEVSQRLTDTLLKAFGLAACSQGTMNNLLFGNARFGYYETICGGTGAIHGSTGTDAVHQHMTNTRITDPEILEIRYPVRLDQFNIRKGSGGKGKWNGGDGVERIIMFKEKLEVNILSQHRIQSPYGMKGGGAGKRGEQFLLKANGQKKKLNGMDSAEVENGDQLIVRTPGGGSWGQRWGQR